MSTSSEPRIPGLRRKRTRGTPVSELYGRSKLPKPKGYDDPVLMALKAFHWSAAQPKKAPHLPTPIWLEVGDTLEVEGLGPVTFLYKIGKGKDYLKVGDHVRDVVNNHIRDSDLKFVVRVELQQIATRIRVVFLHREK